MGLPSEHSNNTAFEHHFLIAYFCLHNQSSNKKNEPIGIGDRGGGGGVIALPFLKFGSVVSKIWATQNIFRAGCDSLKIFVIC